MERESTIFSKENTCVDILRICIVIEIRLEWNILTLLVV